MAHLAAEQTAKLQFEAREKARLAAEKTAKAEREAMLEAARLQ